MSINLQAGASDEDRYIHTLMALTPEQWETAPEDDLVALIEAFAATAFDTGFDRLSTYNLDHHAEVMANFERSVVKAAKKRMSMRLIETALSFSHRNAAHLRGWIEHQEQAKKKEAEFEQLHIDRVAKETSDEVAAIAAWL